MGFLSIQEKPPLRETIIARTPGGNKFRWGEDAWDAADRPDSTSYGSAMPGGYSTLNAELPRLYQQSYPDLPALTELTVIDGAGATTGEFYLERSPRRSGDVTIVSPDAVGFQKLLEDELNVNWLGVDADLNNWGPPTAIRKVWQNAFNVQVVDAGVSESTFDRVPKFTSEVQAPWISPPQGEGLYIPPAGCYFRYIYYSYQSRSSIASNPVATYALYVRASDDAELFNGGVVSSDLYTAAGGSGSGVFSTGGADKAYGSISWLPPAGANSTDGATYTVDFDRLSVVGNHGLTIYTTASGGPGLLASDVIAYLVRLFAPKLDVLDFNIGTTDLVIPHSRGDNTSLPELIAEHNKYHLWDWAVWDKKQFFYNAPGQASVHRTWKAKVGPSNLEEAGRDVRRICNGTYVRFTDSQGVSRVIGPPGTRADTTSSYLLDSDPQNPANEVGRKLYHMVEMRGVSETAAAITAGQAYMSLLKSADRSGAATISGYVQNESGTWFPHTSIKAGDSIRFVDATDSSPRRISNVTHTRSSRSSSVELDAPPETLDAILDRLSLSLVGTGLS